MVEMIFFFLRLFYVFFPMIRKFWGLFFKVLRLRNTKKEYWKILEGFRGLIINFITFLMTLRSFSTIKIYHKGLCIYILSPFHMPTFYLFPLLTLPFYLDISHAFVSPISSLHSTPSPSSFRFNLPHLCFFFF